MIYVMLRGRIGNQLFIYAFAEALRDQYGGGLPIVFDDTEVLGADWINALTEYQLPDVEFIHDHRLLESKQYRKQRICLRIYEVLTFHKSFSFIYQVEKLLRPVFNRMGCVFCQNGFSQYRLPAGTDYLLSGYFQSEKYFKNSAEKIKKNLNLNLQLEKADYKEADILKNRNSVCISIKVEHNIGSDIYDVCSKEYWEKAIAYIMTKVENPLFYICSDNVEYVRDNLLNTLECDVLSQNPEYPVHHTLGLMSLCRHFLIGNTTFGWWAQYLSAYPDKIVVAPSRWMKVDMPIDIYQEGWYLID